MEVVAWSLFVMAISIIFAQILRRIMKRLFKDEIFSIVDETLAAMQCSFGILECGVISGVFGPWSWITLTFVLIFGAVKHFTFIRGKYVGNPVSFIDRYYIAGKVCLDSPMFIASRIGGMVVGALLAHPVSRLFWGKTYSTYHNRAMLTECRTTLKVPFTHGFFVEFLTTIIAWSIDSVTPMKWKPPIRSVVSTSLVLAFLNTSGAWMNPATASAHTFNCSGHSNPWEHFITYWLGPYMAAILFYEIKEFIYVIRENKRFHHYRKLYTIIENENGITKTAIKQPELSSQNHHLAEEMSAPQQNSSKYHRSPGGVLRQRVSSIGPG